MEKIWLNSYPQGINDHINIKEYESINDVFQQSVSKYADRPCFSNMGTTLSYQQIAQKVNFLSAYLQSELNIKKGDRVAVMMPNALQNPIAIFAILQAGAVVVNTNPLYTARELRHQLVDSGATVIIVMENFCHTLQKIIHETSIEKVITTQLGDLLSFPKSVLVSAVVKYVKKMVPKFHIQNSIVFNEALKKGSKRRFQSVAINHKDLAFLQYTGGTTGIAKGAKLSHGNMVANMQQASEWIQHMLVKGEELIITALPLYHIFSLTANCLTFMKLGALNYLITNPRDLKNFVKEIKHLEFTAITGVNTLFNGLMNTPGFEEINFNKLKISLGGGMAVQKNVSEKWQSITKTPLLEAYGLTETSPAVCINPLNSESYNGSIGLPIPSTEVVIKNEKGEILAQGETGELCVKGPQVMQGYWNQNDETQNVIDEAGFLHTGDIAKMDENGYIFLVDRKKDMILVSGFNVYPNEVEAVIAEHQGVLEVGVVGEEDEKTSEKVKAVIVKKDPNLTENDILEYCQERLTAYKIPKIIEFRSELPKTNVGKILRRALKSTKKT